MTREQSLDDLMQIDHVVRVHPDGTVTDRIKGVYAPMLDMSCLDDDCGSILKEHEDDYRRQAQAQNWDLMFGYSGQQGGAHSFNMHQSEFIGGRMERDIRERPGLYVALAIEVYPEGAEESESAGWCVAYRLDEDDPAVIRPEDISGSMGWSPEPESDEDRDERAQRQTEQRLNDRYSD